MNPKYSVLLCNQNYEEYEDRITVWLLSGIKVLWFGGDRKAEADLKEEHGEFIRERFLQIYETGPAEKGIILDGDDRDLLLNELEKDCPLFNAAQFRVEHCRADAHIVVQASAGTGKTTVMIDRILYLMHMVPDLRMSEIYMITFTNDATNEMNRRLQEKLLSKYRLTNQRRYLRWLEEQAQMSISTIHSFACEMLKEYGIMEGFTKRLRLRSFEYESRELIFDILDRHTDEKNPVKYQLGLPLYRAGSMVKAFWQKFMSQGISRQELVKMDWGQPADEASAAFHALLTKAIEEADSEFLKIKQKEDAIGLNDIMRDLQEVLLNEDVPTPDISMKYLFIDEFQDTDVSQIQIAVLLAKYLKASLFVVGDSKQSIYRFRGATAKAFPILERDLREAGQTAPLHFSLVNNYRTGKELMKELERIFQGMDACNYLDYPDPVIPFRPEDSYFELVPGEDRKHLDAQIAELTKMALDDLISRVRKSGKAPSKKDRVVLLVRYNSQLDRAAKLLRERGIPAEIQREGSFYNSEAVRDFFVMICSYLFADEPKFIFQYLMSPYAGKIDPIDLNETERLNGNRDKLTGYLQKYLNQTSWAFYYRELRLHPVMSVLKEMTDREKVVDRFISMTKGRLTSSKEPVWEEERIFAETQGRAKQYQADLEKLLTILQVNLGTDKVSLYDVYRFLKQNISSNRDESEASVESQSDYTSVLCMTAHKSKGLEFDTVILPYTASPFMTDADTEIIIEPLTRKVGWKYRGDRETNPVPMQNDSYAVLKEEEVWGCFQEEARILYVAMTRAIHACIAVVPPTNRKNTWAYLLTEANER